MEPCGDEEIVVISSCGTVAVVEGIEEYQYLNFPHRLRGVEYAEADAREFAATVKIRFEIGEAGWKVRKVAVYTYTGILTVAWKEFSVFTSLFLILL